LQQSTNWIDMDLLLGIDAGTTSVKAGLFSPDGACLGIGRQEYQLENPAPDRAELDPQVYWQACRSSVQAALSESQADPKLVRALSVSSQGETLISLDADGKTLYPALVWLDNRAADQAADLSRRFGKELYARTGIPEVLPTWTACKIMWLRQNEPQIFSRADKFMLVQDYLIFRLTGLAVTDGSISCTTMYYDITRNTWWKEVLDAIGIQAGHLPEIVHPGSMVGMLLPESAEELGLDPKTFVVTGGMDQAVGAIGAGNIAPGTISEATGAALAIQATITDPMIDRSKNVPVYCHSVPGKYLFVPVCPTAGMAFKWLRDTFFRDEVLAAEQEHKDPFDRLTAMAEDISPGSDGLVMLPHLMGAFSPEPNTAARGSFTGFTLSHTRAHFVRALLEGVAFMLKRNLEFIEKTGLQVQEIRSMGGGARSPLWNRIKANVCNKPVVTLATEETGLLGDAIIAGAAAGIFPSIEAGCQDMLGVKHTIQPDEQVQAYIEPYNLYCSLDSQLAGYFKHGYGTGNHAEPNDIMLA
jgi:xylulokinase